MTYKLSEEKELEIFLGTVEEASKHTRSLPFLLLLTSIYVVVAAYTGDWQSETLVLPLVEAEISRRWFFAISPIFILFNYVYFHMYLKDLIKRGMIFHQMDIKTVLVEKKYLFYPSILPRDERDYEMATRSFGYKFTTFCIDVVFWWYGSFVLLMILMAYIFQNDIAALVPYACF